jgi:hypothetical protein
MNQERDDCVATYLGLQGFEVTAVERVDDPRRGRVKVVRVQRRGGQHECPECGRRHAGGLFAEVAPIRLRDCSIGDLETYLEVRPMQIACCGGTRMERLPFAMAIHGRSYIRGAGASLGVAEGQSWAKGVALFNLSANPAHRGARFGVRVDEPQQLRLSVYDVSGRALRVLADGPFPAGTHEFECDLRETSGTRVHSGLYFVRLSAGSGERKARVAVVQ